METLLAGLLLINEDENKNRNFSFMSKFIMKVVFKFLLKFKKSTRTRQNPKKSEERQFTVIEIIEST